MESKQIIRKSVFSAFLLVLALLCVLGLASCGGGQQSYVSPYTWSNLKNENGRFSYYKDGQLTSRTGIDVSAHQGAIDWGAVASDGVEFAMIRVGNRGYTEGNLYLDGRFYANLEGAKRAGLQVGVYFFSQAINESEAREEAAFVLDCLQGVRLDYPVVFDHELVSDSQARANDVSRDEMTKIAAVFCTRMQEAGYAPMVYGNKQDIARFDLKSLGQVDVWFAEYGAAVPSGQFDFTMWQYTNAGTVAGVSTSVDMNIHFLAA